MPQESSGQGGSCASVGQAPAATCRPSSAGNWVAKISNAAARVKPVSTGDVTNCSSQPMRASPNSICTAPDSSVSHSTNCTHCALPGVASPASEAPSSKLVSAVGPTPRRVEELHSTATRAGNSEA